jgi:tetratricopeptide (TPR) repeat protein
MPRSIRPATPPACRHVATRRLAVLALLFGVFPPSARIAAQAEPPRPTLRAAADPNSWESYFDAGVEKLRREPTEAEADFYWASRLAPDRAEPLHARWVAFWMRDERRWIAYLREDRDVLRNPEVIRADSLLYRAALRNPFVHQGLTVLLYDRLPGEWRHDPATRGWIAYAGADMQSAVDYFAQAIARDSVRHKWLRETRAGALVAMGRFDEALAEMSALLRQLRREEGGVKVRSYESKEMVLYGIGLLHTARGRTAPARDAFRQALVENLAFAPAHRYLAVVARIRLATDEAIAELAQAVELDGDDPVLRYEYGDALLAGGRASDAVTQLRLATAREPWWAYPHFVLAGALEAQGAKGEAVTEYREYLNRAPRAGVRLVEARARIAALATPP